MERSNEENQHNAHETRVTATPSSDESAMAAPPQLADFQGSALKAPVAASPSDTTLQSEDSADRAQPMKETPTKQPPKKEPSTTDGAGQFPPHDELMFQQVMRAQEGPVSPRMPPCGAVSAIVARIEAAATTHETRTCSQLPIAPTPSARAAGTAGAVVPTCSGCGAPQESDAMLELGTPTSSVRSIGSIVCRICHNSENPEKLVSPCLCKGSLTYVHIYCLERWISTSRSTICELCRFQYNTEQTLRYTCIQSLRMWYSRSMSRRALQEDCQMFSLLTLIAFCIIGVLLIGIQYYFLKGNASAALSVGRLWTKGWLLFFLFTTVIVHIYPMMLLLIWLPKSNLNSTRQLAVYFVNIYSIVRSQLSPWYRWWQSARDIKLVLENRRPVQFRSRSRRAPNREPNSGDQLPVASTSGQRAPPQPVVPPSPRPTPPTQPTAATWVSIAIEAPRLPAKLSNTQPGGGYVNATGTATTIDFTATGTSGAASISHHSSGSASVNPRTKGTGCRRGKCTSV